jgi:hypothetical protein
LSAATVSSNSAMEGSDKKGMEDMVVVYSLMGLCSD